MYIFDVWMFIAKFIHANKLKMHAETRDFKLNMKILWFNSFNRRIKFNFKETKLCPNILRAKKMKKKFFFTVLLTFWKKIKDKNKSYNLGSYDLMFTREYIEKI
jgi:hypothetical protein